MRLGLFGLGALVVAGLLGGFASQYASSAPDGLERVAIDNGFARAETAPAWKHAPAAGYAAPGVAGKAVAGLAGTAAVFGAGLLLAKAAARKKQRRRASGNGP